MPVDVVLIANRGEIACRIIRTARRLGYRTVAVYSDADADAHHVRLADDAIRIGPAPASASYLDADRLLQAAQETGAAALHPGYGFLSENAGFARACTDAGLVFIGPPADAIELMGNKAAARQRMIAAGVPCVPGYDGADQSDESLTDAAAQIGYPIMVKAAAGGGGRGMRLVENHQDLAAALHRARAEAENAFGSGDLILEKAIATARHVEIQVFADNHGNVIHLGERDCSVQRRHQKVIEEAPCPVMTPQLRDAMGAAAVEAARNISYRGAGTVEFLLDAGQAFYFLEMNTRLQVEHPVTELVTGLDLVSLQFSVAEGDALPVSQHQVNLDGHAIEVRLYAEDPVNDFLPATGTIALWRPPDGLGIRVDAGIDTGCSVTAWYDPLLAKIIAWGENRAQARRRLIAALKDTAVFGVPTNRDFLLDALGTPAFAAAEVTTDFIDATFGPAGPVEKAPSAHLAAMATVLMLNADCERSMADSVAVAPGLANWSSSGALSVRYAIDSGDRHFAMTAVAHPGGGHVVTGDGIDLHITLVEIRDQVARLRIGGRVVEVLFHFAEPGRLYLSYLGSSQVFVDHVRAAEHNDGQATTGRVLAPMHGLIQDVFVSTGDVVARGARLLVLEAMKMQHEILAGVDGEVRALHCQAGEQIAAGALLLEISSDE